MSGDRAVHQRGGSGERTTREGGERRKLEVDVRVPLGAGELEIRLESDEHAVKIITQHKSKGLEFPVVFLVGLVENILPSKKGNLEEERRICFVGMSRAMKLLYLSHSLTYLGQPAKRSIFLDEILGTKNPDVSK